MAPPIKQIKGFNVVMSVIDFQQSRYNVHNLTIRSLEERLRRGYSVELALTLPKGVWRKGRYSQDVLLEMLKQKNLPIERIARMAGWKYSEVRRVLDEQKTKTI